MTSQFLLLKETEILGKIQTNQNSMACAVSQIIGIWIKVDHEQDSDYILKIIATFL